jgi:hypothetical protein
VLTEVAETDTGDVRVGEHVVRGLRDEHLPAIRGRTDAGRAMNVETEIALVGERRLSCVNAHANRRLEPVRPVVELERPLCRDSCPHSILGA